MSQRHTTRIERIWYGESRVWSWLLAPLSWLFGLIVAVRRAAYRRRLFAVHRASVPVIVVGNLSVGGTGKSPFVAWLVAQLSARGFHPGVLARGYGAPVQGAVRVTATSTAAMVGDEAVMLAQSTGSPVVVAPRRADGAKLLEHLGVDCIVCDDGLQHLALARDLEIVLVDAARGFGNGRLLPAGPLRESVRRLNSVDFVVVQGARVEAAGTDVPRAWQGWHGTFAMRLAQQYVIPVSAAPVAASSSRTIESFAGQSVHAVAGIGHPARFFAALRAAGLRPIEHPFADHHAFRPEDISFDDNLPVLMTAKDAVKCSAFADGRCWQVPVTAQLEPDGGRALLDHIENILRAAQVSRGQ